MDEQEALNEAYEFTLGGLLRDAGTFASLLALGGLIAVVWCTVAGLRARRGGGDTQRPQWWLTAAIRVLVVGAVLAYLVALTGRWGEIDRVANRTGSTRGIEAEAWVATAIAAPSLLVPLAVAFLGALASLVIGPPRPRN